VPECRSAGVPECRSAGVPECRSAMSRKTHNHRIASTSGLLAASGHSAELPAPAGREFCLSSSPVDRPTLEPLASREFNV